MPRYYFHLHSQEGLLVEDHEGMDLPDLKAALEEALRVDRDLTLDPAGLYGLEFEITDSAGKPLLKVPVQERRRSRSLPPLPEAEERRRQNNKERFLN
jgi:hypothetical protein